MVLRTSIFILAGYLSGSVLYASVFAKLFKIENFAEMSPDHNPGTANAFCYGGSRDRACYCAEIFYGGEGDDEEIY